MWIVYDRRRIDPSSEKCRVIYLNVQIDAANVKPLSTAAGVEQMTMMPRFARASRDIGAERMIAATPAPG